MYVCIYSYTRSVARFARPLLACACISFVYILHGKLLLVPLYSMSKLNNNGSKARYSNRVPAFTNRDLTTYYLLPPFSQSACQKTRYLSSLFLPATTAKEKALREASPSTTFLCARSGAQVKLPRRLRMSQVSLVDLSRKFWSGKNFPDEFQLKKILVHLNIIL